MRTVFGLIIAYEGRYLETKPWYRYAIALRSVVRQAVSKIAAFEANEVGSIPARAAITVSIDVTKQTVASIVLDFR